MLVIELKSGDAFLVGDSRVEVLATARGKVRVGVEAPPEIKISRQQRQKPENNAKNEKARRGGSFGSGYPNKLHLAVAKQRLAAKDKCDPDS